MTGAFVAGLLAYSMGATLLFIHHILLSNHHRRLSNSQRLRADMLETLLRRKEHRLSGKPQKRDAIGRFTTKVGS
jgi:hypothetical protein